MATSTPTIETAMAHLKTQLATISVASGYRTDVKKVTRILKSMEEEATNMPCLTIVFGREEMMKYTNREIKSTFTLVIYGYVVFEGETGGDDKNAQQLLIKLTADVKEKLSAIFTADRFDSTTENFHITSIETDEGLIEPYSAFRMECAMELSYKAEDSGVVVAI